MNTSSPPFQRTLSPQKDEAIVSRMTATRKRHLNYRPLIAFLFSIVYPLIEPACLANAQNPKAELSPPTAFAELLNEIWDFELIESPLLATNIGDPRGQNRLPDDSLAKIQKRTETRRAFFRRLIDINPADLSGASQIDHELTRLRLKSQIENFEFQLHFMPINNREGFHISFPELPRIMNPTTVEDFENYISRLRDFSRYTDQQIELMRSGIQLNLTQPAIIMRDSASQAEAQVVTEPTQSLFYTLAQESSKNALSKHEWKVISNSLKDAIRTSVVPSYEKFSRFLRTEYLPACRGTISASALPRGRDFYRNQIEHFTTMRMTPEQLHQTGIKENARIREEMNMVREKVGFKKDLPAFLEHLRTESKFYAKTPNELLKEAALILKKADGRLPELFGHLPSIPYGLREVPEYIAPQTTSAYYWPPATDGSRGGFFYLNTYNLSARPLYQLEALSLHEAVPGHHLQLAIQAELTELHPMSRESNLNAFIEGWALYSERLGKEMGFYSDPYQEFGRLSMEAWRASRLVVDTGIHWFSWTREQAINYMEDNTALSKHNIIAEVDRYIGWPGQALSYKTGELAIRRIRMHAEQKLGEDFDIREFHDRVLEAGAIPIPLLESRIDQWIKSKIESIRE